MYELDALKSQWKKRRWVFLIFILLSFIFQVEKSLSKLIIFAIYSSTTILKVSKNLLLKWIFRANFRDMSFVLKVD